MSLFAAPVCPACQQRIPMKVLRRRLPGFIESLDKRMGIECPVCRALLKLDGRPVAVVIGGSYVMAISVLFAYVSSAPAAPVAAPLAAWLTMHMAYRYGPWFVGISRGRAGDGVVYAADLMAGADRQWAEQRRAADAAALEEDERVAEINDPRRTEWSCATCTAQNPATFDICWQCQAVREAPDPDTPHRARARKDP